MPQRTVMTRVVYAEWDDLQIEAEAHKAFAQSFPDELAFFQEHDPDGYRLTVAPREVYPSSTRYHIVQIVLTVPSRALATLFSWRFWDLHEGAKT